ncbi:hypothetical protein SAMN05445850_7717 [Paraburkholderia tuberum]|uniref:Uncharacterized protein n=1 Tax=Paraburkholderia tuberum TaxID=157910 RepID=A0A1H1KGA6_9BURK|nr:hypothetical protein SAMN05445850_7717 [Paraburkholderia tuberum]
MRYPFYNKNLVQTAYLHQSQPLSVGVANGQRID